MADVSNVDRSLTHWQIGQIVAASVAATAALIGGTAAVAKFFFLP